MDTNDPNSPWKDIVDQNLDNQYNQGGSGSSGSGGGGSSDDGGGGSPPPPTKEQRQAALNAVLSAARENVQAATLAQENRNIASPGSLGVMPLEPIPSQMELYSRNPMQDKKQQEEEERYQNAQQGRSGTNSIFNNVLNKLSNTTASATGSILKALGEVKKNTDIYLNSSNHVRFYPKTSIPQIVQPLKRVAKAGTIITAVTNIASIGTVWAENKGNTVEQKIIKSSIKIGGAAVSMGVGVINVGITTALGLAEPVTGGLTTAGIVGVATLDVIAGEGINRLQEKLFNKLGIK